MSKQQADFGFLELGADSKLSAALLDQNTASGLSTGKAAHIGNHFLTSAQLYAQNNDKELSAYCYESALGCEEGTLSWLILMEAGRTAMDLNSFEDARKCFKKAFQAAKGKLEKRISGY